LDAVVHDSHFFVELCAKGPIRHLPVQSFCLQDDIAMGVACIVAGERAEFNQRTCKLVLLRRKVTEVLFYHARSPQRIKLGLHAFLKQARIHKRENLLHVRVFG